MAQVRNQTCAELRGGTTVLAAAKKIGDVEVDVGDTACKVPSAADAIAKVKARGSLGKMRKTVKC